MNRRPRPVPPSPPRAPEGRSIQDEIVTSSSDVIRPWLVNGAQTYFLQEQGFDPRPAGVQLICYVYIPRGQIGFLKSVRVAPYMPPVFSDPFLGWDAHWREQPSAAADGVPLRPGAQFGLWETPAAWEGYGEIDDLTEYTPACTWYWHLRAFKGTISDLRRSRRNFGPFDITNATTWFLVDEIAVPAAAYAGGRLPGNPPFAAYERQKIQVLPKDPLMLHVPIAEDMTLCLFASWTQTEQPAYARNELGRVRYTPDQVGYYPILPSFGQLAGYMQPADRPASLRNAAYGW